MNNKLFEKLHANRVLPDISNAKDGDVPTISVNAYEGSIPVGGDTLTTVGVDVNKLLNTNILEDLINHNITDLCIIDLDSGNRHHIELFDSAFVPNGYQIIVINSDPDLGDWGWVINPTDEDQDTDTFEDHLTFPAHSIVKVENGKIVDTLKDGFSYMQLPESGITIFGNESYGPYWKEYKINTFMSINGDFKAVDAKINWRPGTLPSMTNAKDGQTLKVNKTGGKDGSFLADWSKELDRIYFDTNLTAEDISTLGGPDKGGYYIDISFSDNSGDYEFDIDIAANPDNPRFSSIGIGGSDIEWVTLFNSYDGWNTGALEYDETKGYYYLQLNQFVHVNHISYSWGE